MKNKLKKTRNWIFNSISYLALDERFGKRFPYSLRSDYMAGETGRSMIEMLGVLAIIGVLSVGGIAGYTSAMRSHRTNEILNATSMLYMMGLAQNAGEGTGTLTFDTAFGASMRPSGCGGITYKGDTATLDVNIEDETICKQVKTKLGDKAGDCTAATGDATGYTLTVTLGEVTADPEPIGGESCEIAGQHRCNYTEKKLYECLDGTWRGLDSCGNPDNDPSECLKGSSKCSSGKIIKCNEGWWGQPETDTEGKCVIEESSCTTGNYKCEDGEAPLYKCVNGAWERYCSCMDGCSHPNEEASNISDVCMSADIYCG